MSARATVFLVDDEPAVLNALGRLLRAEGYSTESFNSGQEFIERYKRSASGCLVLDVTMPGISGLDVQKWLTDSGDPLPIIFLTAREGVAENIKKHINPGATVLIKPALAADVLNAIEEALR